MNYRIGWVLLQGKTVLESLTIIDITLLFVDGIYVKYLTVVGNKHKPFIISTARFEQENIFAVCACGIKGSETQDKEGRFSIKLENEIETGHTALKIGTKVQWVGGGLNPSSSSPQIKGYVIRNSWSDFYLVSEQGVSVEKRHWKIPHNLVDPI
jgi:hypothetical protein